mmetsp:Transcript_11114/g.25256  ORF Transcript_11114/g.25256 Transcript_11114/m.25256 type:complete len:107 (-) Transcript_11114:19-339(-)
MMREDDEASLILYASSSRLADATTDKRNMVIACFGYMAAKRLRSRHSTPKYRSTEAGAEVRNRDCVLLLDRSADACSSESMVPLVIDFRAANKTCPRRGGVPNCVH